jgi:hypothetical protein
LRFGRAAHRRFNRFKQRLRWRYRDSGTRLHRDGSDAFDHLTGEPAMLRGGVNLCSIRLRQVHDKAIVAGFERERIPTRRSSSPARRVDFSDNPDLVALMENLVRDGTARASAMQHEIVVDYFASQQGTAESGPHAKRQVRGVTPRSVRSTGRRPGDRRSPGGAGAPIRPRRHSDFGNDSLASE